MARNLDRVAGVAQAAANAGTLINRKNIRFIDDGGVTWTATDDPINDEVEVRASAGGSGLPAGTLVSFGGTAVPSGWLECDGAAVNRVTYAALFAAVGTAWGSGDGFTTFNVPSLARRTLVGRGGAGTGTLGNAVGNIGGAETHTLITAELASHNHGDSGHTHNVTLSNIGMYVTPTSNGNSYIMMTGTNTGNSQPLNGLTASGFANISSTGGSGAHNNMQPSAVVMMIIKT